MDFKEGMICPICENAGLINMIKDMDFEYKGSTTKIQNMQALGCGSCGEFFLSKKDEREIERILADHRRRVDGLLTSGEIKEIRCQFDMTQIEFAVALRVGEKNFARYESGAAVQSTTMDNLLRVLKCYPDAINGFYKKGWNAPTIENVYEFEVFRKKKTQKPFVRDLVQFEELATKGEMQCLG